MSKPSLFPSPSFRWPDHSPYCPGRPGYKGVCDCGAETPSDVAKLRAERDELLAALEAELPDAENMIRMCHDEGFSSSCKTPNGETGFLACPGCAPVRERHASARALIARIKGGG